MPSNGMAVVLAGVSLTKVSGTRNAKGCKNYLPLIAPFNYAPC